MGRNAARRRVVKLNAKLAAPANVRVFETRTKRKARELMAQIETRAQFEQMVAKARPEVRAWMRQHLAYLLKPSLPCCGQAAAVKATLGEEALKVMERRQHGEFCPLRTVVEATA